MRLTVRVLVLLALPVMVAAEGRAVPLVGAAKEGDERALRALLQRRVDVNASEADGTTALHWAAHRGDVVSVELLLRAGARAAAANAFGITPLSLAAASGSAPAVDRLLKAGARANTTENGGQTVLMSAARAGRADVVRLLIEAGADVNAREATRGQTALMWAAAQGHADVLRLLVQRGADIRAVSRPPANSYEKPPAFGTGLAPPKRLDTFTPLQFAIRAGHVEATAALLDVGASISELAPETLDLLGLAIVNVRYDVAALLIERGADVHFAKAGATPLHRLAFSRTPDIGQFPRAQPKGRVTSLDVAEMLLARGAEVDARTTTRLTGAEGAAVAVGSTAFLIAAKGGDVQMMRFLAANGADVRAVNANRTTATALAAGLEMNNPNQDSGTDADSFEALKLAIALGAGEISAVNNSGDSALHGAIFRGTQDNIRLLVEHGANLQIKNKRGKMAIEDARDGLPNANNSRRTPKPEAARALYDLMAARGLNPPDPSVDKSRYTFGVKVDK